MEDIMYENELSINEKFVNPFLNYVIPEKKKNKITNERQSILKDFIDSINRDRVGTKFKEVSTRAIAMKVSHITTNDLRYFYSVCLKADNFSKCFFGRLKVK